MKHHYVPEAYLRHFSTNNTGHFFRVRRGRHKVKPVHASGACYQYGFYSIGNADILKSHGLTDPLFLETHGFPYESRWPSIVKAFTGNKVYVDRKTHEEIIRAYISLKQRTLLYRKQFTNKQVLDGAFEAVTKRFVEEYQFILDHLKIDFDRIANEQRKKMFDSGKFPEETHLRGLIESVKGTNTAYKDALIKILGMNFEILTPRSTSDFFLTCDNPGFSLDGDKVWSTNFGKFDSIIFPLSSSHVMRVYGFSPLNHLDVLKRISTKRIDSNQVEIINRLTMQISDEFIFCESKDYLANFIGAIPYK